ncbi:MAG: BlaI/MecI/CopY family transcriptional regulator [Gammaproteobacteria bacterium]|nr:BlaI/MecI/CopY family transcriptional regulator [Gammaproteobacteria bacterium]
MTRKLHTHLSRRESQIMDVIYKLGEGGVAEVRGEMEDPPSYNSVRVILGILEEKDYLTHSKDGSRYIYRPKISRKQAVKSAAAHFLNTFFSGSTPQAVATLLDMKDSQLSQEELDKLSEIIEEAKARKNNE